MAGIKELQPLKIGLVLDDTLDTSDGVQQYVLALGNWLTAQGHEVHYLVGQTSRSDIEHIHSLSRNMHVRFNGNTMSMPLPADRRRLTDLLRDEKFDILHVQMPYSPFLAHRLILSAPASTVIVGTFHILPNGILSKIGTRGLALWTRRSLSRFSAVFSVSSEAQKFAVRAFKTVSVVIPNVIDYPRFHTAKPLPQFKGKKTATILFVGRLVSRKGCQTLLEAAVKLRERGATRDYQIVICGKGPLRDKLGLFVMKNNLTDIVRFEGFIDEAIKPRYFASADIAVFPSSGGESFGIVLLEAMASGKAAVLAGDNPGYRTVMEPKPTLLFPATSSDVLADKLHALLIHEDQRLKYAAWGGDYSASFDVAVIGQSIMSQCRSALRKNDAR